MSEVTVTYYAKNGDDYHAETATFTEWSSGIPGTQLNEVHAGNLFDDDKLYYRSSMTTKFIDLSSYQDGSVSGKFTDPVTNETIDVEYPVMLDCFELNTFKYDDLELVDGTTIIDQSEYDALVSSHDSQLQNSRDDMDTVSRETRDSLWLIDAKMILNNPEHGLTEDELQLKLGADYATRFEDLNG